MAELSIPAALPNHNQLFLFPEIDHLHPPFNNSAALSGPFQRGPMYRAYADLRDWKLRMKKAGLSPSTPIPLQLKRPAVNTRPPVDQRFDPSNTPSPPFETQWLDRSKMISPPPPSLNKETKRFGNLPSGRGGPPRSGSGRADEFLLMRGFSSFDESAAKNNEDGERGRRSATKGIFRKTLTAFRGPTAKTNSS
ncbi:hypothetical protein KSP39_PZI023322 [Platanthera zijinensis]|uniref:Uncharacterized protein n=1 Tax=Platanthera zijinensis TaxID=2320716 RepID=A0AAP0FV84_9ASPA